MSALDDFLDGQVFHELCMDYRGAPQAQCAFKAIQQAIREAAAMSLRDYFAAKALPQAIAREVGPLGTYQHFCDASAEIVSRNAYIVADAMLRMREA